MEANHNSSPRHKVKTIERPAHPLESDCEAVTRPLHDGSIKRQIARSGPSVLRSNLGEIAPRIESGKAGWPDMLTATPHAFETRVEDSAKLWESSDCALPGYECLGVSCADR
jgi:hypothetical protein